MNTTRRLLYIVGTLGPLVSLYAQGYIRFGASVFLLHQPLVYWLFTNGVLLIAGVISTVCVVYLYNRLIGIRARRWLVVWYILWYPVFIWLSIVLGLVGGFFAPLVAVGFHITPLAVYVKIINWLTTKRATPK